MKVRFVGTVVLCSMIILCGIVISVFANELATLTGGTMDRVSGGLIRFAQKHLAALSSGSLTSESFRKFRSYSRANTLPEN
jgi:hypothetical protein